MAKFQFFAEWQDTDRMRFLLLLLLGLTLGVYLFFLTFPDEAVRALLYTILLVISIGILCGDWLLDLVRVRTKFIQFAGWGDLNRAIPGFLVGALIMLVGISTTTLSLSAPLSINVVPDQTLEFIYVVVAAWLVEETFFRSSAFFTVKGWLEGAGWPFAGFTALLLISAGFAGFHGFVYSWELAGLAFTFTFSIFAILGNQVFKSSAFGCGAHFTNNLIVFLVTYHFIPAIHLLAVMLVH